MLPKPSGRKAKSSLASTSESIEAKGALESCL
jgi:hypothetical protein